MSKPIDDGVIREGELYTLAALKERLKMADSALRNLRRCGIPVIRLGNRPFYSGRQVIEYLERRATHEQG